MSDAGESIILTARDDDNIELILAYNLILKAEVEKLKSELIECRKGNYYTARPDYYNLMSALDKVVALYQKQSEARE